MPASATTIDELAREKHQVEKDVREVREDHWPVRAVVGLGGAEQKAWLCEECQAPWPCAFERLNIIALKATGDILARLVRRKELEAEMRGIEGFGDCNYPADEGHTDENCCTCKHYKALTAELASLEEAAAR